MPTYDHIPTRFPKYWLIADSGEPQMLNRFITVHWAAYCTTPQYCVSVGKRGSVPADAAGACPAKQLPAAWASRCWGCLGLKAPGAWHLTCAGPLPAAASPCVHKILSNMLAIQRVDQHNLVSERTCMSLDTQKGPSYLALLHPT